MLKIGRRLGRLWNPICSMPRHQDFSILFMKDKEFSAPAFDVLIQDIDEQDLHGKISKILGKTYLAPLQKHQKQFQETRTGVIYGYGKRGIISLPTRTDETQPIWVHYLVDTGAPYSFLTQSTLKALKVNEKQNIFSVLINGHRCSVKLSGTRFQQVNLLGMDFLDNRRELNYDLRKSIMKITDDEN